MMLFLWMRDDIDSIPILQFQAISKDITYL